MLLRSVFITVASIDLFAISAAASSSSPVGIMQHESSGSSDSFFVAERNHEKIDLFDGAGKLTRRFAGPAGPMAADEFGNLFVADWNSSNDIQMYKPPQYTAVNPMQLLPGQAGSAVAVYPKSGLVAVLSYRSCCTNTPDYVSFFRHGYQTWCNAIRLPVSVSSAATFDHEGTLYFDANTGTQSVIAALPGGCKAKAADLQILSFEKPILPFGNVAFDAKDEFVIQDFPGDKPGPIYTYAHPTNGIVGNPLAISILPPDQNQIPFFLGFSSDGLHLWGGTVFSNGSDVLRYPYPNKSGSRPDLVIHNVPDPQSGTALPPLL